jgi:hypothetical protein
MNKPDMIGWSAVGVYVVALAWFLAVSVSGMEGAWQPGNDLQDRESYNGIQDDRFALDPQPTDPQSLLMPYDYEYMVSNYSMTFSLNVTNDNSSLCVIDCHMEWDLVYVSCEHSTGEYYDLDVLIMGLYINISLTTADGAVHGGTLTIDCMELHTQVTAETERAILQAALEEAALVEQWVI